MNLNNFKICICSVFYIFTDQSTIPAHNYCTYLLTKPTKELKY